MLLRATSLSLSLMDDAQTANLCSALPLLVVRPDTAASPTTARSSVVACAAHNLATRIAKLEIAPESSQLMVHFMAAPLLRFHTRTGARSTGVNERAVHWQRHDGMVQRITVELSVRAT